MPLVQGSSDFKFHDNQITVVEGSQYNDNRTFQIVRQETRELTIWDEFKRVRIGNVNLIKAVVTSDIYGYDGPWWLHNRNRRTVARRTISVARIRGEDKEAEFLYVRYSGPEARQTFKRDFDQFSAVKHLNVAQLFGYSDSQHGLPALIFYDALIPLSRVLLSTRGNKWVELYFRLQAMVAKVDGHFVCMDPNALWIEPRGGALRRGPYVQSDAYPLRQLFDVPSTSHLDPLSIQTYRDTNTVIDYLARIFPINMIFKQVGTGVKFRDWRVTAFELWPYIVGSLWKRNQQPIIARWTGFTQIPQYVCVEAHDVRFRRCGVVMKDGSVRFQFVDPSCFRYLQLQYRLFHGSEQLDIESVWFAQAHSIFGQLGVHEDEWDEYCDFRLTLYPYDYWKGNAGIVLTKPTPYLFVRPIPRPSDNETTWRSWAESTYFWSLDPSGQEEILESTRVSLELPDFEHNVELLYISWDLETYRAIGSFQHFKGFDPKTTDCARSLSYPLMQVVGNVDRFQELGESNDDCLTSKDEESMSVDHDPPCPDNASHNIIPPPRPNDTSVNEMPDTKTNEEVTVGNKRKSTAAGSSSKHRKVHTDHGEDEDATTGSTIKRLRTTAAYAENPVQVPKRGSWDNLPQRELSSRKVRPSVRAQEAREVRSEGSASKKRGRGGRNGQGQASGKAK
uniref:Protein kinase domain-containing protein n=1 Tax=Moniliophthora roreri TaxID=221103 RepID=A0A0W0FC42_MONRR